MQSDSNLVMILGRGVQALNEAMANATQIGQLKQNITAAQTTLASLQGQIAQAKTLAAQVDEVDQHLREKRAELASLDSEIAKKHALHGQADSALRDLRKKISGDPTHA